MHPSAQMGLLRYLSESAMDGDYQLVASRTAPGAPRPRVTRGVAAAVVTAVFGLLVVTAAGQTSRNVDSETSARGELATQYAQGRKALEKNQAEVRSLRSEVAQLREGALSSNALSTQTRTQLRALGTAAGTTAVKGEGVVLRIDDAPNATTDRDRVLDMDLQRVVNGLWAAGAEAISINGHRLGSLSAIRQAGAAITVNYDSLNRPYVITAIGDRARLPARFAETSSGRAWLDLQRRVNLQFSMTAQESLQIPGHTTTLRHAKGAGKK